MSKTLASYWRFLVSGLHHQAQTGAVLPSQRFLVEKMIAPVPLDYRGLLVELGPGTGVLTRRLAARCPRAPILACEINPNLATQLEYDLAAAGLSPQVQVVCDSAEHLLASRARKGLEKPRFIFSGIPLANLGREPVLALLKNIRRALAAGGMYIQYQHSLLDRQKIKDNSTRLRTVPVFLNVPPAVIYYAIN